MIVKFKTICIFRETGNDFQLPGLSIFKIFTLFEIEFHGYQSKLIVEYVFLRKNNEEITFLAIGNSSLLKEYVQNMVVF